MLDNTLVNVWHRSFTRKITLEEFTNFKYYKNTFCLVAFALINPMVHPTISFRYFMYKVVFVL